jgi:hypothetical protein
MYRNIQPAVRYLCVEYLAQTGPAKLTQQQLNEWAIGQYARAIQRYNWITRPEQHALAGWLYPHTDTPATQALNYRGQQALKYCNYVRALFAGDANATFTADRFAEMDTVIPGTIRAICTRLTACLSYERICK